MPYPLSRQQIVELLRTRGVWFETFEHEAVTTSEEAAKVRSGYTLRQGAKAIVIKVEKRNKESSFVMLAVPADLKLNSKKVKVALDIRSFRFATEEEIIEIAQGIQRGGVPPFGNLFIKPVAVYVDKTCLGTRR